jgi:hypothetical protein
MPAIANTTTTTTRTAAGRGAPSFVPPSSGGVSAGLRGGALSAAVLCLHYWLAGAGFWLPMKAMAALWLGPPALLGGAGTDALGLFTHLAGAAALGGLFAAVLGRRAGTGLSLVAGLAAGACVWALCRSPIVKAADETLWIRVNLSPGWWLFADLLYGASLARVPHLRRRHAAEVLEERADSEERARTFY